ncbi:MAG TPA: phosphorylated adapter RNA export RNA-binding domain-containing protein [Polyangiaceae bacterium]|nr:phosphorylated adapter RNA export RNA-binding domain-containing protein [Polyangiaceae bacterium]
MATADAANTIAESLKETDEIPRKQIAEIVEVLGADASLALLAETQRVQGEGGIAVRDGTRRRTDGGVFFSLAKAQLPKADRNRIFRIRPPKSPESERAAQPQPESTNGHASAKADSSKTPDTTRVAAPQTPQAGRRRMVEVEVLRTFPKSKAEPIREIVPREAPPPAPVAEPSPARGDLRPLRRIVTVAAPVETPQTPEAAKERILALLKGLGAPDQKRVVGEVARELGVIPEPSGRRIVEPPRAEPKREVDTDVRERVLAAVTDALGLAPSDLAEVLFGEDSPAHRSKARLALDKHRKNRGG